MSRCIVRAVTGGDLPIQCQLAAGLAPYVEDEVRFHYDLISTRTRVETRDANVERVVTRDRVLTV